MKLLHTADWHLGKKMEHISRHAEQTEVLDEICRIADEEDVDAILIAGDLFDGPNPPIESLELFYKTLRRLTKEGTRAVIGIGGNHDSPDRVSAPDPLARASGILLTGYPEAEIHAMELETGLRTLRRDQGFVELSLPRHTYPLRLILTPYANELRLRKFLGSDGKEEALRNLLQAHWAGMAERYCDKQGANVLVAHLFVARAGDSDMLVEDEDEKSLLTVGGAQEIYTHNFPSQLDYVALGHLHGPISVQKDPYPIVYSSSPLCYSLGDTHPEKSVVIATLQAGSPAEYRRIPLHSGKKLLRLHFESVDEAVTGLALPQYAHALIECIVSTDTFLNAQDARRIREAHPDLIRIVPDLTGTAGFQAGSTKNVDLSKDMLSLFSDYFEHKKGSRPSAELMDMFLEILGKEVDSF